MAKKIITDITIILDRSSSMLTIKSVTIEGFNSFIDEQPGQANLTLVQFDLPSYVFTRDWYETTYNAIPIADAKHLTNQSFVPRGSTPLLDAMGKAITETDARMKVLPKTKKPNKVVIVVITDGEENSSKEWTQQKIKELIESKQEKDKWEFVFLGANIDAVKTGGMYGFKSTNTMDFAANSIGTRSSYESLTSNLTSYRVGKTSNMGFTSIDKSKQKKAMKSK
jgi:uncharacterized protein YegL